MEANLNKFQYKLVLLLLKFIPFALGLSYAVYTILGFFGIDLVWIGNVIHLSIIPWLFIYLASFVFKFCIVHRLPLYYILINDALIMTDSYLNLPIETVNLFAIHLTIIAFFIALIVIFYLKEKNESNIKKTS